jgi:hypothetical protein
VWRTEGRACLPRAARSCDHVLPRPSCCARVAMAGRPSGRARCMRARRCGPRPSLFATAAAGRWRARPRQRHWFGPAHMRLTLTCRDGLSPGPPAPCVELELFRAFQFGYLYQDFGRELAGSRASGLCALHERSTGTARRLQKPSVGDRGVWCELRRPVGGKVLSGVREPCCSIAAAAWHARCASRQCKLTAACR